MILNFVLWFIQDSFNYLEFFNLFIDKNNILFFVNLYNLLFYTLYKIIKQLILNLQYYIMQYYVILVYNNMWNFYVNYIYYYYWIKEEVDFYQKYLFLRILKYRKFIKYYYRLYLIDYGRVIFFALFLTLFFLMWKRRNTYLKREFLINLLKFYMFTLLFSFLITPLFSNTLIGILIPLIIAFLLIYFKLN